MKIVALIAARTGSSRFPSKVLQPVLGRPMLERMIERIRSTRRVQEVVVATTREPSDDALAALADTLGVGCFRGQTDDVLGRLQAAAAAVRADLVIELLGDNPLVHAALIEDTLALYERQRVDYAATVTTEYPNLEPDVRCFPTGIRVQVFAAATLNCCAQSAVDPAHREHSTSYIAEHPEQFRLGFVEAVGPWAALHRPELTFAVNYPENLQLVRRIFERCYPRDPNFTLQEALRVFDADPSLAPLMGRPAASGVRG